MKRLHAKPHHDRRGFFTPEALRHGDKEKSKKGFAPDLSRLAVDERGTRNADLCAPRACAKACDCQGPDL